MTLDSISLLIGAIGSLPILGLAQLMASRSKVAFAEMRVVLAETKERVTTLERELHEVRDELGVEKGRRFHAEEEASAQAQSAAFVLSTRDQISTQHDAAIAERYEEIAMLKAEVERLEKSVSDAAIRRARSRKDTPS